LAAVQDFSQGQAVAALAARPGEVILDMCSAPGGKSAALADMGARVVACDSNLLRLAKVGNLFTEATEFPRVVMDGTRPAFAPESFDAVLVDAPCSNTGVLARRVEAKWRQQDEPGLITLQQKLLQSAAALVKPGGRLVYATCSLLPQENEAIAASLPGWSTEHAATIWPNQWQAGGYHARLVRDS
jgi:16S rRNA (cytosine967-C5)-methyltransferase